jgi:hypothetical protein
MSVHSHAILTTMKGPSFLQDERLVLAGPNQRQFTCGVTMIIQHSHGLCILGDPPCCAVAKSRTPWLSLPPSINREVSPESGGGIS